LLDYKAKCFGCGKVLAYCPVSVSTTGEVLCYDCHAVGEMIDDAVAMGRDGHPVPLVPEMYLDADGNPIPLDECPAGE
jgi:hypothetical protein